MGFFPVPRHELPTVTVSSDEHHARKLQMQRMLESLVEDYERYTEGSSRQVDMRRWRASATRGQLKLYKERRAGGRTHGMMPYENIHSEYRDGDRDAGICSHGSMNSFDGMTFSEETADNMRMTLMVGECAGRMENAMYAVIAANQQELSLVDIFLHEDVADCAILHMMEGPHAQDPYYFLGYKWFVRKSPTTSHLVKHRDSVYIEYSGLTKTRSGEELGYHIMHSVDLVDFPEMTDRNCVRTSQSIRALYRQRPGNVVEVFIMGNVDIGGTIGISPIANMFIQETLFNMPKLIDCGESKRLTKMLLDFRSIRDQRIQSKQIGGGDDVCALCRQQKKFFGGATAECDVCALDVCGKCRLSKRVYQNEGILGRFYKITCCKTCILAAKDAEAFGLDGEPGQKTTPSHQPSSIRTMSEQLEIRSRSGSHVITASGSSVTSEKERIPHDYEVFMSAPPAPVPIVRRVTSGTRPASLPARTRLDSNLSTTSTASSNHSPVMSNPLAEIVPLDATEETPAKSMASTPAASSQPTQNELYMKMLELQKKAQEAYLTTKQNQMYLEGQKL